MQKLKLLKPWSMVKACSNSLICLAPMLPCAPQSVVVQKPSWCQVVSLCRKPSQKPFSSLKCESGRPVVTDHCHYWEQLPEPLPVLVALVELAALPRAVNHHPPVEKSSVARALAKQSRENIKLSAFSVMAPFSYSSNHFRYFHPAQHLSHNL